MVVVAPLLVLCVAHLLELGLLDDDVEAPALLVVPTRDSFFCAFFFKKRESVFGNSYFVSQTLS